VVLHVATLNATGASEVELQLMEIAAAAAAVEDTQVVQEDSTMDLLVTVEVEGPSTVERTK
jgi:hypothetical protein